MNRQRIEQLVRRWQQQTILRDVLFALAAASFVAALKFGALAVLVGFLIMLLACLALSRPWELTATQISRHLDRTCPEMEESATLFLRPRERLSLLEKLQLDRVNIRLLERTLPDTKLGNTPSRYLLPAILCLLTGVLTAVVVAVGSWRQISPTAPITKAATSKTKDSTRASIPKVLGNVFTITPPGYTGHAPRQVEGLAAEVEEGSTVTWRINVDPPPRDACLIAGSSRTALRVDQRRLEGTQTVQDSALFALTGTLHDGSAWNPAELFSIKIIKDQSPVVRLVQPAQTRTEIVPPATASVVVEAIITDDYTVAEAHLVATVAKGSGESVKFREQTIPFDAGGFTKALDLAALGMEPGDEMYFYIEAHDNRQPAANRTRSETRFIRLRGPEERPATTGRGIAGVNLIPQYFRSERQLIIDTEKLIADRPTLPDAEFRSRANDLGADQALLRLRYGRFLGEDQEDGPLTDHLETTLEPLQAAAPAVAPGPHAAASIAQRFLQEHVEQDREGGGEDSAPRPPSSAPLTADQVRQPFVDSHDQHDKNTFFDSETKGTMRDALAAMWAAEGALRTTRPEEALTPEHRALDILKDLQQSSRAYVQHVGFEAAPLKVAERRLKGEVTGVPAHAAVGSPLPPTDPALSSIRTVLAALTQTADLSAEVLDSLLPTLTTAATRQPEMFLPGLQALRSLRAGNTNTEEESASLQRALLRLLPPASALPELTAEPAPTLATRYFEHLQTGATRP